MITFKIDQAIPNKLNINDVQIYPTRFLPKPIHAFQVKSSVSEAEFKKADEGTYPSIRLSYQATIRDIAKAPHHDSVHDAELLTIAFKIIALEGKKVNGLDTVKAMVVKDGDGKLIIVQTEIEAGDSDGKCSPHLPDILCRLQHLMSRPIHRVKLTMHHCRHRMAKAMHRCHHKMRHGFRILLNPFHHGHRHGQKHHGSVDVVPSLSALDHHTSSPVLVHDKGPAPNQRLNSGHDFGHLRHGHHRGGFFCTMKRIAAKIFVPMLIGLAAGMTASVLGMMVGQIVVFVYRRFYRQRCGTYVRVGQLDDDAETAPVVDASVGGNLDEKPYLDEGEKQ